MTTPKNHRPPPHSISDVRPVDRAFIHAIMFELGIVPIEDPAFNVDVPLFELSPEESRKMRRRFRKLWRSCAKERLIEIDRNVEKISSDERQALKNATKQALGMGRSRPTREQKIARKRMFYERVWNDRIVPMLIRFENPDKINR